LILCATIKQTWLRTARSYLGGMVLPNHSLEPKAKPGRFQRCPVCGGYFNPCAMPGKYSNIYGLFHTRPKLTRNKRREVGPGAANVRFGRLGQALSDFPPLQVPRLDHQPCAADKTLIVLQNSKMTCLQNFAVCSPDWALAIQYLAKSLGRSPVRNQINHVTPPSHHFRGSAPAPLENFVPTPKKSFATRSP